ncbi:hypothetical protein BHE74_00044051, partial [Ensete ventricosum]
RKSLWEMISLLPISTVHANGIFALLSSILQLCSLTFELRNRNKNMEGVGLAWISSTLFGLSYSTASQTSAFTYAWTGIVCERVCEIGSFLLGVSAYASALGDCVAVKEERSNSSDCRCRLEK